MYRVLNGVKLTAGGGERVSRPSGHLRTLLERLCTEKVGGPHRHRQRVAIRRNVVNHADDRLSVRVLHFDDVVLGGRVRRRVFCLPIAVHDHAKQSFNFRRVGQCRRGCESVCNLPTCDQSVEFEFVGGPRRTILEHEQAVVTRILCGV